ncbi:MAG: DUF3850 domain-containing protein [Cytophagales bacterium]|nr:DUF3850 domain-containing protein [Cytophagales bacterium]
MSKILLISIKPQFAERIFSGNKSIELRKTSPKVSEGDLILFYVTSPEKMVKGIGRVKGLIEDTPANIWSEYQETAGIGEELYFDYYQNSNRAIGILLKDVVEFKKTVSLSDIKSTFPSFAPPQSYRYLSKFDFLRKFSHFSA